MSGIVLGRLALGTDASVVLAGDNASSKLLKNPIYEAILV